MNHLTTLRAFWGSFCLSDLYDTGYSDAVTGGGATKANCTDSMVIAMAYMVGYANACRIASPYMSTPWQVANLVGIAAGTFLTFLRSDAPPMSIVDMGRTFKTLCAQYTRDLEALVNHG